MIMYTVFTVAMMEEGKNVVELCLRLFTQSTEPEGRDFSIFFLLLSPLMKILACAVSEGNWSDDRERVNAEAKGFIVS